jgi:hypothetical protein
MRGSELDDACDNHRRKGKNILAGKHEARRPFFISTRGWEQNLKWFLQK